MLLRTIRAAVRTPVLQTTRAVHTRFREPDPSKPKIVLAYSGGLDTSCQVVLMKINTNPKPGD